MLTPIDIQNHSLKTAVRGYSKKETDDFLDEILKGYEELYKENRDLKDKVTSLSEGIQYYKQMETTLQKALVLAEKTSSETQEAAKSKADAQINEAQAKAEAMIKEAQAKAEAILKESQSKADGLRKEIQAYSDITKSKANRELEDTRNHVRKLVQSYENYRLQFKKLAESQIEMLESEHYSIFAPELEEMLGDAPDADAVMDAERNVPINASDDYYERSAVPVAAPVSTEAPASTPEVNAAVTEEPKEEAKPEALDIPPETSNAMPAAVVPESVKPAETANEMPSAVSEEEAAALERARLMAEIKIPDMEITADTIVPGIIPPDAQAETAPAAVPASGVNAGGASQESGSTWENTTPKVAGYNPVEGAKTVTPKPKGDTSPFDFIEIE